MNPWENREEYNQQIIAHLKNLRYRKSILPKTATRQIKIHFTKRIKEAEQYLATQGITVE